MIFRNLARYYTRQRNLLRPAFLLGDSEIYERAANLMRHASEGIAAIVRQKTKAGSHDQLDKRVDLGTRAVYALLQQRMVFHPFASGRHMPGNDDDMAAELALLFKRNLSQDA
jgi:hypothetical protein